MTEPLLDTNLNSEQWVGCQRFLMTVLKVVSVFGTLFIHQIIHFCIGFSTYLEASPEDKSGSIRGLSLSTPNDDQTFSGHTSVLCLGREGKGMQHGLY